MKDVTEELNRVVVELRSIIASVNNCYEMVTALYEKQERERLEPLESDSENFTTGTIGQNEEPQEVEQEQEETIVYNAETRLEHEEEKKEKIPLPPQKRDKKGGFLKREVQKINDCKSAKCKHNKNNICKYPGGLVECEERT